VATPTTKVQVTGRECRRAKGGNAAEQGVRLANLSHLGSTPRQGNLQTPL